nr:stealth family protein [Nocardiopsis mwathae]
MEERHADSGAFIGRPRGADRLIHAALFADGGLPKAVRDAAVVRVGEVLLGPAGQVVAGADLACDVEFWRDGAAVLAGADGQQRLAELQLQAAEEVFSEALVAPRRNRVSDVVPPSEQKPAWVRVRERDVATFQPFTELTVDDVDFPIDVVYTWVDGDEPAMREKRTKYIGETEIDIADREFGESRYTSHDELRYSLRSVWMYAPFVRNIYVVTDGQVPRWLDTSVPGVRVVDHREIFPEGVLPVFNSHAIETRLHHIPGLSEHYLYFNDDVFVGRPVTPQHFFQGSGIMRVPMSPLKIGLGDPHFENPAPNSAGKNVRRLLKGAYGRFTTNKFMHTPHPQVRTLLHELEERFPADFDRTMRSRFRSITDIPPISSSHHHALMTGRAVRGGFTFRYIDVGKPDAGDKLAKLGATRKFDFFCVNDVDSRHIDGPNLESMVTDFLEAYFPCVAPWEL